jgi:hypothetical protein
LRPLPFEAIRHPLPESLFLHEHIERGDNLASIRLIGLTDKLHFSEPDDRDSRTDPSLDQGAISPILRFSGCQP